MNLSQIEMAWIVEMDNDHCIWFDSIRFNWDGIGFLKLISLMSASSFLMTEAKLVFRRGVCLKECSIPIPFIPFYLSLSFSSFPRLSSLGRTIEAPSLAAALLIGAPVKWLNVELTTFSLSNRLNLNWFRLHDRLHRLHFISFLIRQPIMSFSCN